VFVALVILYAVRMRYIIISDLPGSTISTRFSEIWYWTRNVRDLGFRSRAEENCAFLGYYARSSGNFL